MGGLGRGAVASVDLLVGRAVAGDVDAFNDLYHLTLPKLRAVTISILRDAEAAAEVVQETYVRAFERLADLRERSRFEAWIASIARHLAADHGRSRSRLSTLEDEDAHAIEEHEPGPEAIAELTELSRLVEDGIAQLSKREATALAFVSHFGLGPTEFAPALGVSPGAARVILHRARTRLRTILAIDDVRGFSADATVASVGAVSVEA